jgi:hypothetical protein
MSRRAAIVARARAAIEQLRDAPKESTARGEPDERQEGEADEPQEPVPAGPDEPTPLPELRAAVDRLVASALEAGLDLDPAELASLRDELQRIADGAFVRSPQDEDEDD